MGRKPIDKVRIDNPELRADWVQHISPYFFKTGLTSFNMNEISTILDISKATLYKHYATHLEVLEEMIDMRVARTAEFDMILFDTSIGYWERYKQSIVFISNQLSDFSATFVADLKVEHPYLFQRIMVLQNYITNKLHEFYKLGVAEGLLANDLDPHFLAVSDHAFIIQVCEPQFLKENKLTLQDSVNNYFNIKLKGIFKQIPTSYDPTIAPA